MRFRRALAFAVVLALQIAPVSADQHFTLAGSGTTLDGACIDLYAVANRRWTSNWWPQAELFADGICPEEAEHHHLEYNCKILIRQKGDLPSAEDPALFYASARVDTKTLRVVIVDRGLRAEDEVGLSTAIPRYPSILCGASEVVPRPVAEGGYSFFF